MSWLDYKLLTQDEVRSLSPIDLPSSLQAGSAVRIIVAKSNSNDCDNWIVFGFVVACDFSASKVRYSVAFPISPQARSGTSLYVVVPNIPSEIVSPNVDFSWDAEKNSILDSVSRDAFQLIENAANAGAMGNNSLPEPSQKQKVAGNYKVGRLKLYGLDLAIEQPRGSVRSGRNEKTGVEWSNRMAAHYGYISGTKGADGDGLDVFICTHPESKMAYVINQVDPDSGAFDEHKIMLAAADKSEAESAYKMSYDADWKGLGSIVPITLNQLRWWVKNGDTTAQLDVEKLPEEGYVGMKITEWKGEEPVGVTIDSVLYDIRRHDSEMLLLDSVSISEIVADSDGSEVLDALVTPFNKLQRNMERLQALMTRVTEEIKPVALQISDPFKQRGVANIAALYELSDGQTITIYFHNPDTDPKRILPNDELVSWKWMLNKKDITIIAAPERGQELSIREVARRTMRLAAKNSAAFKRANGKRAERLQSIADLKATVEAKESQLKKLQRAIEVKQQEKQDAYIVAQAASRAEKSAAASTPPSLVVAETKPPEAVQDEIVEHYENRSEGVETIVVKVDGGYVVRVIYSENGEVSTLRAKFDDLELAKQAAQQQAGLIKKVKVAATSPLPDGWSEASPGGMATNKDPINGGIIDKQIGTGEWFAIPQMEGIDSIDGFNTRAEAFAGLAAAVASKLAEVVPEPVLIADPISVAEDAGAVSGDQMAEQAGVTGADAGATAQAVEDDAFMQSVIDGAVDIFDASLPNRLQEIVGRISSDQDRMVKWNQAVSAFSASMMTAAISRLAA